MRDSQQQQQQQPTRAHTHRLFVRCCCCCRCRRSRSRRGRRVPDVQRAQQRGGGPQLQNAISIIVSEPRPNCTHTRTTTPSRIMRCSESPRMATNFAQRRGHTAQQMCVFERALLAYKIWGGRGRGVNGARQAHTHTRTHTQHKHAHRRACTVEDKVELRWAVERVVSALQCRPLERPRQTVAAARRCGGHCVPRRATTTLRSTSSGNGTAGGGACS